LQPALHEKGLREFALAANLEGIRAEFQFVQVFGGDLPLFEAIEKVLAEDRAKPAASPTGSGQAPPKAAARGYLPERKRKNPTRKTGVLGTRTRPESNRASSINITIKKCEMALSTYRDPVQNKTLS